MRVVLERVEHGNAPFWLEGLSVVVRGSDMFHHSRRYSEIGGKNYAIEAESDTAARTWL